MTIANIRKQPNGRYQLTYQHPERRLNAAVGSLITAS